MRDYLQLQYNYLHKIDVQIRINDIDFLGHVNNAIWQEYFDVARVDYFENVIGNLRFDGTHALIIANVNTNYISSIYFRDKPTLETKIVNIGNKSIKMFQKIIVERAEETFLAGVSEATMVCVNQKIRETAELPKVWREKISSFEHDIEL
jgi:acyl-CoA thioester hydrolase